MTTNRYGICPGHEWPTPCWPCWRPPGTRRRLARERAALLGGKITRRHRACRAGTSRSRGSPGKVAEVPPGLADAYLVSSGRYRRCQLPRRAVAATGPGARSVVRPNARPGVADVRLSLLFCLSTQTLRLLPQWQAANASGRSGRDRLVGGTSDPEPDDTRTGQERAIRPELEKIARRTLPSGLLNSLYRDGVKRADKEQPA